MKVDRLLFNVSASWSLISLRQCKTEEDFRAKKRGWGGFWAIQLVVFQLLGWSISVRMCSGSFAKCLGITLIPLSIVCVLCNILLFFPGGTSVENGHITKEVWYFGGLLGSGVLVSATRTTCSEQITGVHCTMRNQIIKADNSALHWRFNDDYYRLKLLCECLFVNYAETKKNAGVILFKEEKINIKWKAGQIVLHVLLCLKNCPESWYV